jgi:hypothetical protein
MSELKTFERILKLSATDQELWREIGQLKAQQLKLLDFIERVNKLCGQLAGTLKELAEVIRGTP